MYVITAPGTLIIWQIGLGPPVRHPGAPHVTFTCMAGWMKPIFVITVQTQLQ